MEKNKGLFSVRKYPVGDFPDGKKERKRKGGRLRQSMGFLLAAALLFNTLPASGLAVSASGRGLCEHHTEHTAECGYTEAQPCTHEHTEENHSGEECYKTVTECVHTHTDECYPEMGETEESAGEGNATASDAEDQEPESCTHSCSEESGCITKVLDCHHEHDESCGYTEAQECGYVCEICNGTKPEDTGDDTENSKDANTDAAGCICETSCTEDSINGDCPVCGAEGADLSCCEGKETEESKKTGDTDINLCAHHKEHTAECGYSEEDNTPCGYECRICPIEDLIAVLPDKVTEDNAEEVREQLDKILDLYRELTGEEQEQLDISHCLELQAELDATNKPMPLADGETDSVTLAGQNQSVIFTKTACLEGCKGHTITQQGTVIICPTILVESGTHDITFQGLNLTDANVGVMPGAAMNLTISGTNKIVAGNAKAGIYVPVGAELVITEQSTGSLDVSGNGKGAGIGGAEIDISDPTGWRDGDLNCGTVIINGGTINATGGSSCAGIGGGCTDDVPGNGGDITINGGTVTATGGSDQAGNYGGAGIGGGSAATPNDSAGSGGRLTINGGAVNLTAGSSTSCGFGKGTGSAPNGTCELILADKSCLTVDSLDTKGKYTIKSAPTAGMISVPEDMHYTSADMAAEIAGKVTLSGKVTICDREFKVDTSGWTLSVTKVSDMEYTATYIHADKGTISKTVTILPCIHNNGAALTHHEGREADCMQTGVMEHWECTVCGKKFSDAAGQTEITDTEIPTAHNLTHYAGKEADCTQTGVMEYWECTACGKKFSDKDGQTEITDTEIPIAAHTLTHHDGKEADCTHTGTLEYWECSVCKKKFSDQDGKKEIADADIVISVKPHTLIHHAKVEAGCLTEGSIEYWSCDVCHKLFDDASGTKEITDP